MSFISPFWILDLVLLLLIGSITYLYINFKVNVRKHWAKRSIAYEEPTFLIGNMDISMKISFSQLLNNMFLNFKKRKEKVGGFWIYHKPCILLTDIEIIKRVLVNDFSHFHDRGLAINEELEPLTEHLFNMTGQKWRNLRVKLTPTFTSGKMKMMFEMILKAGVELQHFLEEPAGKEATIEIKEILAEFTTDVIASTAFGIETKSLGNPDSEFRRYGRMIFDLPMINVLMSGLLFATPWLKDYLPLRTFPKAVSDFFMDAVKGVISQRQRVKFERKDFMQLLIELINNGRVEDVDHKYLDNEGDENSDPFTVEQAAAQAFVFFFAGFETSSTSMMLTLYELACNPDIQARLQTEIDQMLEKESGKISYNALLNMEYLDQVVQESLRKYPPIGLLLRSCTKDYYIPEVDFTMEKGCFVVIPIEGIQKDPEYFPNPEKFDPDRYSAEAKKDRDSFLNLAFGQGPRVCIGSRFGILQIKVGLVMILSKYKMDVVEATPIPLVFDPKQFISSPIGGMPLRISKR